MPKTFCAKITQYGLLGSVLGANMQACAPLIPALRMLESHPVRRNPLQSRAGI
jgi:hypothetical protein